MGYIKHLFTREQKQETELREMLFFPRTSSNPVTFAGEN